jgi:replicative DNA helicase
LSDNFLEKSIPHSISIKQSLLKNFEFVIKPSSHFQEQTLSKEKKDTHQHPSENTNEDNQKTFDFDRTFQEKIVQAMLLDRQWAAQFAEVLQIDYFQYAHLKLVADQYTKYHTKYKEFPSGDLLLSIIKEKLKNAKDAELTEEVKKLFFRVEAKQDLGDLGYIKEQALDFCKKAGLQKALERSIDHIQGNDYDKILGELNKAIASGNEYSAGLDLYDDIEARYSETYRRTIATGIQELDQRKILNGGLGSGELGICVAPSGVGKTHFLVQMGASAIQSSRNVIHYTFELNERVTGIRYDSNLTNIPSLDCYDQKEKIKKFYEKNKNNFGKLLIKYIPSSEASCYTIKNHIDKLNVNGFIPDLILVDYAGMMKSASKSEFLRIELKKVCEELRELAVELDCPVWTALQSNKEGSEAEVVDLKNMAESYAQGNPADFVLGLSRKSQEKSSGFGNIFVAKNRAGLDGIKYLIHLDTARSKLKVLTSEEAVKYKEETSDEGVRNILRRRFQEVCNEKESL